MQKNSHKHSAKSNDNHSEARQELAKHLVVLRKKADLTQIDVAGQLGYSSAQFVSNWERGVSSPPLAAIKKLSKLYSVDPGIFLDLLIAASQEQVEETLRHQFKSIVKKNLKKA
jgi:transcriptional regulator with XRE-family HTH domain